MRHAETCRLHEKFSANSCSTFSAILANKHQLSIRKYISQLDLVYIDGQKNFCFDEKIYHFQRKVHFTGCHPLVNRVENWVKVTSHRLLSG